MIYQYSTIYTDSNGIEETTITNDGKILRMVLRGVTFEDTGFDSFEPIDGTNSLLLRNFTLNGTDLCSCKIEFVIPVLVVGDEDTTGKLICTLDLGPPSNNRGIKTDLSIILKHKDCEYASSGKNGGFEYELIDIQEQLPSITYMKACINCQYSDYDPGGNGCFGTMLCFRNIKSEYLKVKTKDDLFQLLMSEEGFVQETYLCDQFERRVPGSGYRG